MNRFTAHVPAALVVALSIASGARAGADAGSPIADAARNRDEAAVKTLIRQRVDVNAPAADGTTALHWAANFADLDSVTALIEAGANVNAVNRYGATPLWLASTAADPSVIAAILKGGANPNTSALVGEPPLMAAARAGSVDAVSLLLNSGADVNARDRWRGQTALMWAVGGHEPHPDVVRVLLDHGADVTLRSSGSTDGALPGQAARAGAPPPGVGLTALFFAVRQNDLESTKLLLGARANVNDKGPAGATPLVVAINNGHYDLARYLLDTGADANAADASGSTPLHTIVRKRVGGRSGAQASGRDDSIAVLKALLTRGAAVNARTPTRPRVKRLNPSSRPEIDDVEYGGVTPFWLAANAVDLEAMRLLVAGGADPRLASMEDTTPLIVAAGLGYGTVGALGRRVDSQEAVVAAVTQLLEWANDVNAVNKHGQTALHGAASAAAPLVVQLLIERGAAPQPKDAIGRTPLQVADDNRTDKYRSNQDLDPTQLEPTYALLLKLTGTSDAR